MNPLVPAQELHIFGITVERVSTPSRDLLDIVHGQTQRRTTTTRTIDDNDGLIIWPSPLCVDIKLTWQVPCVRLVFVYCEWTSGGRSLFELHVVQHCFDKIIFPSDRGFTALEGVFKTFSDFGSEGLI